MPIVWVPSNWKSGEGPFTEIVASEAAITEWNRAHPGKLQLTKPKGA